MSPTPEARLAAIEELLHGLSSRLGRIEGQLNGQRDICLFEQGRIERLERAVGKQNFLAALFGSIGAAVILAIEHLSIK